jgi:hypothetical protein
MRVIALNQEPRVIDKILKHLRHLRIKGRDARRAIVDRTAWGRRDGKRQRERQAGREAWSGRCRGQRGCSSRRRDRISYSLYSQPLE